MLILELSILTDTADAVAGCAGALGDAVAGGALLLSVARPVFAPTPDARVVGESTEKNKTNAFLNSCSKPEADFLNSQKLRHCRARGFQTKVKVCLTNSK